jgi:hypothetical protein
MKKHLPWIVCAILAISTGVLLFLTFRANQEKSSLGNTLGDFTNSTIATQVALLEGDQEQIATYQVTQTALQDQLSLLESELTTAQSNSAVMTTEIAGTKASYDCTNKAAFHPDYSSNLAMSNALKSFVKDMTEGVIQNDTTWVPIWSNYKSAIHYVYFIDQNQTRIIWPFAVFFVEKGLSVKQGVLDLNSQCWLDHW